MELEKIYTKIEKMDEKLDLYIREMEGRVSRLEEQVKSQQGFIKIIGAAMLSVVGSITAYFTKQISG